MSTDPRMQVLLDFAINYWPGTLVYMTQDEAERLLADLDKATPKVSEAELVARDVGAFQDRRSHPELYARDVAS